jgi:hypothetical protein
MTTETDLEKLVPWGLSAREYAALALLLLDQAGLCVRDQKRVEGIVEDCPGHARVIAAE